MSEIEFVPDYYSKWDIDHFSPSQDAKPLDNWFYEYCVNTQAWRRNKKPNPNMKAGNSVQGDTNRTITTQDGTEVTLEPFGLGGWVFNNFTEKQAIDSAVQHFKEQCILHDWQDKDKVHADEVLERIPLCIKNSIKAFLEFGIKKLKNLTTEKYVSYKHDNIDITTIGRMDIGSDTHVIEFKTRWFQSVVSKKTNKIGFRSASIPATPMYSHNQQVAFYNKATDLIPVIIYASGNKEDDYAIFTPENCDALTNIGLSKFITHSRSIQLARQNLLKVSDDPEVIAAHIQPDFDHYMWRDYKPEDLEEVKSLWKM
tara:strand:- start:2272 stop:3210 length:939 start_codon:yes stop_codon:yes gene_type:complete